MQYDAKTLRKVGRMLNKKKMMIASGKGRQNPLYSVRVYKDEIQSLLKGEMPEEWAQAECASYR